MKSLVTGVALSYLLILVKLIATLLFTPFLVASLGVEGYGLYALVGALAAYLYILDFGMNDSVLRFFVRNANDPIERDRFLARMLGLYAIVGVVVLLVTYGLGMMAEPVLGARSTPEQVRMLRDMIFITGGGAAVLVALNPIGALLSATESFVFLRGMEIAVTIISTLMMVAVLHAGGGAVHIVAVAAFFTVLQAMMRLVYAMIVLRARVRLAPPEIKVIRQVGGYAAPIFIVMIAELLFWRLDSILIGAMLGAAPIAIYAIGVTFNKYFMSFATALSRVMTPEIIRQIDQGVDAHTLTDMMIRISRIQAMFLLLILSGLIVFGQRFLVLWLGPQFAFSYWIMLVILVPYTFELAGNARNIILQVKGLYWQRSAITLAMGVLNIPLTLVLLQEMGVLGAALATGAAIMAGYILIALLLRIRVGMEMTRYWVQTGRGIVPIAVVLTALGLWAERFLPEGWVPLIVSGLTYTAIFCLVFYRWAANQEERAFIARLFSRLRLRRGRHA
jgi:O-antigen/teichoic acid export membrane protein